MSDYIRITDRKIELTDEGVEALVSDYTPTTEDMRDAYERMWRSDWVEKRGPEFDRWLVEHDRQIAARAWHEGWMHDADYMNTWGQFCPHEKCNPYREETE